MCFMSVLKTDTAASVESLAALNQELNDCGDTFVLGNEFREQIYGAAALDDFMGCRDHALTGFHERHPNGLASSL